MPRGGEESRDQDAAILAQQVGVDGCGGARRSTEDAMAEPVFGGEATKQNRRDTDDGFAFSWSGSTRYGADNRTYQRLQEQFRDRFVCPQILGERWTEGLARCTASACSNRHVSSMTVRHGTLVQISSRPMPDSLMVMHKCWCMTS